MSEYHFNTKTGTCIRPMFCPSCSKFRQSQDPTFLMSSEEFYYNSFGMCSRCMEFINDPKNKEIVDAIDEQMNKENGDKHNDV